MIESQLFAAVVGALIGILPAFWIGLLRERSREKKNYQAWLFGLSAELSHINKCIVEIEDVIQKGDVSTKRMNSDFVKAARLRIFSYDKDTEFLEMLTNAYRDIVHTNDMLERFEKRTANKQNFQTNVLASMKGVGASVKVLQDSIAWKANK